MPTRSEVISQLLDPGVIPVIRASKSEHVLPVCEALLAGGLNTLEITMTTPNALELIQQASKRFSDRAVIGAGTVMNPAMCLDAIKAGASFVVSPVMVPGIAHVAQGADCVSIIGAFTPTEAQLAHEAGADFIKIFPADSPAFIKAILSPMPHLKLIPTSGINLKNAPEYFAIGCPLVGVASNLVSAKIMQEENWTELTRLAAEFVAMARKAPRK